MKIVHELIKIFLLIIPLVMGEEGGADPAAKHAAVLAEIKKILADSNEPLNWPPFLSGVEDLFLNAMIKGAVRLLKTVGAFVSARLSSQPSGQPPQPPR